MTLQPQQSSTHKPVSAQQGVSHPKTLIPLCPKRNPVEKRAVVRLVVVAGFLNYSIVACFHDYYNPFLARQVFKNTCKFLNVIEFVVSLRQITVCSVSFEIPATPV